MIIWDFHMLRFLVATAAAACLVTAAAAQTSPSKPLNVAASSGLFNDSGPDSIIIFRLVVSETGRVASYEVLEEYPKGQMISPARAETYMSRQRYKPALKDGIPVADEVEQVVTHFSRAPNTSVRPSVTSAIKVELEALRKHDTSDAALEEMAKRYADGTLTLSELGWYFYLQAPLNRMRQNFAAGADAASKALDTQGYLPKGRIIVALKIEQILGYLAAKPERALRLYDGWVKQDPKEVPPTLTALVERYRAAPDKDYSVDIAYFGEAKPDVRESATGWRGVLAAQRSF